MLLSAPNPSPVFDAAAGQIELHYETPRVPTPPASRRAQGGSRSCHRLACGTQVALTRPSTITISSGAGFEDLR